MNHDSIYENGRHHLRAAEVLPANNYFGFAIAHLILGGEELIKYQVALYHDSLPSPFKESQLKAIFSSHKEKHNLWKQHQHAVSDGFSKEYVSAMFLDLTGKALTDKDRVVLDNVFRQTSTFFQMIGDQIKLTPNDYASFLEWIKTADSQKQEGLYVQSNGLNPERFQRADYENVRKYAIALESQSKNALQVFADMLKSFTIEEGSYPD